MSVKVDEIDKQHKKLIDILNELFDLIQIGKSNEALSKILEQLVEYTMFHFKTEEKYFEAFNYPLQEEHVAEHNEFRNKVDKFIVDYKAGKVGLSSEILKYLQVWIYTHILDVDKKYSSHFNKNGLE